MNSHDRSHWVEMEGAAIVVLAEKRGRKQHCQDKQGKGRVG